MKLRPIRKAVERAPYGKRLPDAFYVHYQVVDRLPKVLAEHIKRAFKMAVHKEEILEQAREVTVSGKYAMLAAVKGEELSVWPQTETIVKVKLNAPVVSFLRYPFFIEDPHPALAAAIVVNVDSGDVKLQDFSQQDNPPILHRKELFIPEWSVYHKEFAALTRAEEKAGLYPRGRFIGRRKQWAELLKEKGVDLAKLAEESS